jgi:hypothetical protein
MRSPGRSGVPPRRGLGARSFEEPVENQCPARKFAERILLVSKLFRLVFSSLVCAYGLLRPR